MVAFDSDKMMLRKDGEFWNAVTERPYHINALRNQLKSAKYVDCPSVGVLQYIMVYSQESI